MSSFLQSREWAEIQERDGRSAHQLTFGAESLFYFTHRLPLGFYYFYAPRPTIKKAKAFLDAIRELQKSTRAVFFRVEPETTLHIPPSTSSIKSAPSLQPRETTVIDLLKSYNELLGLNEKLWVTKKFDLNSLTKDIKICHPEISDEVYSQVLQNVGNRLSKAFDNFFRRVKEASKE